MNADIVIVGGGLVGATLACALSQQELRVILIEPRDPRQIQTETPIDLRVSAITRASQRVFERLGLWESICERGVSPFREMHVWEQPGRGEIHFDSADISESCLGHIIENRVMLAALYDELAVEDRVELVLQTQCQTINQEDVGWQITTSNGSQIEAQLLIAADGSRSWVRQQAGITVRGWDYQQEAVVTYLRTALPHQHTAWQRFLPGGPLAFLPLNDNYSSIVWSTTPAHARDLLAMSDEQFSEQLVEAYEGRLGAVTDIGPRASFPLRFLEAEHYVMHGLALTGDAAHTIHPLAGQGVNLGILDAASLAEVLSWAMQRQRSIASLGVLRRYERWRKAENRSMLLMVDQMQRLFSDDSRWTHWMRNVGMGAFNQISPLKNLIISHAMGNRGDLPQLAR